MLLMLLFFFFLMIRRPPRSTLFPYTTLFRSLDFHFFLDCHDRDVVVLLGTARELGDGLVQFFHELGGRKVGIVLDYLGKPIDRKSTRLNSSHQIISYAVFCLKKKKKLTPLRC